jgi:hypothetical protein
VLTLISTTSTSIARRAQEAVAPSADFECAADAAARVSAAVTSVCSSIGMVILTRNAGAFATLVNTAAACVCVCVSV